MPNQPEAKIKLVEAAKEEFLENGYEKASLRNICKKAGVTTGALYFFYKNKEDLFVSIVGDKAERLLYYVKRQTEAEVSGSDKKNEFQKELNLYMCENKEEVRILLDKSKGTPYEDFCEEYCAEVAKGFYSFYDMYGGTAEYRDIMKLIVKMRIQGYIEMLNGDYDMDQLMRFSEMMETYGDCGFVGMMKQFKEITKGSVK